MEVEQSPTLAFLQTRKRKKSEPSASSPIVPLDELNEDLLEKVLACLPPSSFFRLRLVCKRWRSAETSTTFRDACSRIPLREPWFYMVGSGLHRSVVFDTSEGNWKNLNQPKELVEKTCSALNPIPVASSGGLVCFRTASGSLIVSNPVTGACRELPQVRLGNQTQVIHAMAMKCNPEDKVYSYKLVMVSGEFPNVAVKVYESTTGVWEEIGLFQRRPNDVVESDIDDNVYFLSKTGDVVATYMQRSPSKQYSAVMTVEGGEDVIHFLSPSGAIVACNLAQRSFFEYQRLLLPYLDHSLDVVECNGEVVVVVLSDFLETASLRVWKFCKSDKSWQQVTAMPPSMSHEFYGRKMDINCVGFGEMMFVCVNSNDFNGCFTCDLKTNQWMELPKCVLDGKVEEFMAAFCFQPRIEACV